MVKKRSESSWLLPGLLTGAAVVTMVYFGHGFASTLARQDLGIKAEGSLTLPVVPEDSDDLVEPDAH